MLPWKLIPHLHWHLKMLLNFKNVVKIVLDLKIRYKVLIPGEAFTENMLLLGSHANAFCIQAKSL